MGMDDKAYDINEELDNLERERIEKQNVLDFHHEELQDIKIQLSLLKEKAKISNEIKSRLNEKIQESDNCHAKIKSHQNELKQINEKIIEIREALLDQQQVMISEVKPLIKSQIPSETSYTAPQIQVTPDVIADQRLGIMEKTFRELIVKVLDLREPWTKDKIPSDIIRKVTEQRQKNNILDDVEVPLVNELDFTHYKEIFIYNANWQLFKDVFVDRQGLETKLTELAPIRNIIAHHKRAITETESKRVDVYFDDIMKLIIRYEGK